MNSIKIRFVIDFELQQKDFRRYRAVELINSTIENAFQQQPGPGYLKLAETLIERNKGQIDEVLLDQLSGSELDIQNVDSRLADLVDRAFTGMNYNYKFSVTATSVVYNCIDIKLPEEIYVCYQDKLQDAEIKFLQPNGKAIVIQ